jgi:hypothetical protein
MPNANWLHRRASEWQGVLCAAGDARAFPSRTWVDTETRAVVDWTWGKNQPTGLAVSPDGRAIAFSNFLDDQGEVYDFSPDEVQ